MNDKRKINLANCLSCFEEKRISGDFYPVFYGIEISRYCNFSCIMCPNSKIPNEKKGNMSFDTFRKVIDEIGPYAQIIKFHWVGEPLINKFLVKMIHYARERTSAQLFMSTNASLLSGNLADEIRTSGLDKIIFSLDGYTKEIYESIRPNSNFNSVFANVDNFIRSIENNGGPICEVKIIQFDMNKNEIAPFIGKWKTYKKVIVNVMWLSTWGGQLQNLKQYSENLSPYAEETRQACSDLWFKMQIDWSGQVALCCWDWSGSRILGNILNESVKDIWQGKIISNIRNDQLNMRYLGICSECNEWAKVKEYEFWYSYEELIQNPGKIWMDNPSKK